MVLSAFIVTWAVKYGNAMHGFKGCNHEINPHDIHGRFSFFAFPIVGIMLDKWGRIQIIILALFCSALGMLLLALCPNPFSGLVYVAVLFTAFGMAGSIAALIRWPPIILLRE